MAYDVLDGAQAVMGFNTQFLKKLFVLNTIVLLNHVSKMHTISIPKYFLCTSRNLVVLINFNTDTSFEKKKKN